jgi:hypothetical protein
VQQLQHQVGLTLALLTPGLPLLVPLQHQQQHLLPLLLLHMMLASSSPPHSSQTQAWPAPQQTSQQDRFSLMMRLMHQHLGHQLLQSSPLHMDGVEPHHIQPLSQTAQMVQESMQ